MSDFGYWNECIETALEEEGISATREQIENIAKTIHGAHENYSTFMGHDVVQANYTADKQNKIKALEEQLTQEREKVTCKKCNGLGYWVEYYGSHCSQETCWKCNGEGRHNP